MFCGSQRGEVYGIGPYLEHGQALDGGGDLDLPTSPLASDGEHEISFGAIYDTHDLPTSPLASDVEHEISFGTIYDTPLKEDVFMGGTDVPLFRNLLYDDFPANELR